MTALALCNDIEPLCPRINLATTERTKIFVVAFRRVIFCLYQHSMTVLLKSFSKLYKA